MDEQTHKEFIQWCNDGDWIIENYWELLCKYENQWIAVKDSKIIDHDPNIYKLLLYLKNNNESLNEIQTQYIQKYSEILITKEHILEFMTIMGAKQKDGRYYIRGTVTKRIIESGRPDYVNIEFLVDTSQQITTISESQALKHGIDYKNLKKEGIVRNSKNVEAYVLSDCELEFINQRNSNPMYYHEKFDKIFIPNESFSENNPETHISRLGLDFFERFTIKFLSPEPKSGGIVLEKHNSTS